MHYLLLSRHFLLQVGFINSGSHGFFSWLHHCFFLRGHPGGPVSQERHTRIYVTSPVCHFLMHNIKQLLWFYYFRSFKMQHSEALCVISFFSGVVEEIPIFSRLFLSSQALADERLHRVCSSLFHVWHLRNVHVLLVQAPGQRARGGLGSAPEHEHSDVQLLASRVPHGAAPRCHGHRLLPRLCGNRHTLLLTKEMP